jgi:hypothetical protein
MDEEGNHRYISAQTPIGSIDHDRDTLMLRPAGSVSAEGVITTSIWADSVRQGPPQPAPPPSLCDDPETNDPNETRVLFKIEQRAQEVRLVFTKKAKVGDARKRIADLLGAEPGAITLLFSGKALQDTFIVDRLRVGAQGINVYIKEETEVLLLTAKAYRIPR